MPVPILGLLHFLKTFRKCYVDGHVDLFFGSMLFIRRSFLFLFLEELL